MARQSSTHRHCVRPDLWARQSLTAANRPSPRDASPNVLSRLMSSPRTASARLHPTLSCRHPQMPSPSLSTPQRRSQSPQLPRSTIAAPRSLPLVADPNVLHGWPTSLPLSSVCPITVRGIVHHRDQQTAGFPAEFTGTRGGNWYAYVLGAHRGCFCGQQCVLPSSEARTSSAPLKNHLGAVDRSEHRMNQLRAGGAPGGKFKCSVLQQCSDYHPQLKGGQSRT